MLKHITIQRLFSQYNYEIEMTAGDGNPVKNIIFLTGPNGMGKSTILRCIASLYKRQFAFFMTFPFERMAFEFDQCTIEMRQYMESEEAPEDSDIPSSKIIHLECIYTTQSENSIQEYGHWVLKDEKIGTLKDNMPNMKMYFTGHKCLYLSDQRMTEGFDDAVVQPHLLKDILRKIQAGITEGYKTGLQKTETGKSKADRLRDVMVILNILDRCGISLPLDIKTIEKGAEMSDQQIDSCENAIAYCGDLITKLLGFYKFVNDSKFVGKDFKITINNGLQFYAQNEDRTMLSFSQLSLGEKHIISQIYTMYFSPIPYQLVLVDEPELSFHLMWQQQYLGNIKVVQGLRNCGFLIATHSTQVFEGKFELATDLFEQNIYLFE